MTLLVRFCCAAWFAAALLPAGARADGSVAHGEDGTNGLSYNYRGPRAADEAALNKCGDDCRVVERFRHSCAAIARSRRGGYGYAVRDGEGQAERSAMENCERYNESCRIFLSGCDD